MKKVIQSCVIAGLLVVALIALRSQSHYAKGASTNSAPYTAITAIWANDGTDKVTRDEIRATGSPSKVINSVWDGSRILLSAAKNEVVAFNLVLETADLPASGVSVEISDLRGPSDFSIKSPSHSESSNVFRWHDRNIELFLVRYLQIKGLSRLSYDTYDERHIPERMRRPVDVFGKYTGGWVDRADHDKFYPDIAVPMELFPQFSISARSNQSVWADVYIPKQAPSGRYFGELKIHEGGALKFITTVELVVGGFTLPDSPSSKTMLFTSWTDVARRYTGQSFPEASSKQAALTKRVMDRQMMVAHRHKISLVDDNEGATPWLADRPRPEWIPRLSGLLYTAENGYSGPGEGTGNDVFSIGTYGIWRNWWGVPSEPVIWAHTDKWEQWFQDNFPSTERFLYLIDESPDLAQTEKWAKWIKNNPNAGRNLPSMATVDLLHAEKSIPSLSIVASWMSVGDTQPWQAAVDRIRTDRTKRIFFYNGKRPASGSFATEDDGVALREVAWGQFKKRIDRWFAWEATYYNDNQGGRGETNVFQTAQTFGGPTKFDPVAGMSGWNSTNGDGVLFYPGIDAVFPDQSLGIEGPIASLRLKHWRRGIQDVDYLNLAAAIDPIGTQEIVDRMVPKALWEYGVSSKDDPTWVLAPVSWSSNPNDWEAARAALARIIEIGVHK